MPNISITKAVASIGLATAAALAVTVAGPTIASADRGDDGTRKEDRTPVSVEILAPRKGDNAGQGGKGWLVNLAVRYPGGANGLKAAGYQGPQLTGPGAHNNTGPFPGTFSPGRDDRLPGLVVLASTTSGTAPGFSGPGTNLANLFNVTGVTNRTARVTEITDSWIVGAPFFGTDTDSVLTVAVVDDLNQNGAFDDAPAVVADSNHDGRIDVNDLTALGLASRVETVAFHIDGDA